MLKTPIIEFFSAIHSTMKDDEIVFNTIIVPSAAEFSSYLPDTSGSRGAVLRAGN